MRAVLLAVLLLAPVAVAAPTWSGSGSGAVWIQEWDVYNLWVNATGTVRETVSWTLATGMEDLSITVYKPGAWDAQCGRTAQACTYFQDPDDIVVQSFGCPPFRTSESAQWAHTGAKRYHVVVEANLGRNVPYTLATSAGSLTYNGTATATVVYVPPC